MNKYDNYNDKGVAVGYVIPATGVVTPLWTGSDALQMNGIFAGIEGDIF